MLGAGEASILAVAVTACGTVGATFFAGWRDDRDRERKVREAAAQRSGDLAQEAAEAVNNALHSFERRRVSDAGNVTQRGELFDEQVLNVTLLATRVALHFRPGHAATRAYDEAFKGLDGLRKAVFREGRPDLGPDFADEEAREVRDDLARFLAAAGQADVSAAAP